MQTARFQRVNEAIDDMLDVAREYRPRRGTALIEMFVAKGHGDRRLAELALSTLIGKGRITVDRNVNIHLSDGGV